MADLENIVIETTEMHSGGEPVLWRLVEFGRSRSRASHCCNYKRVCVGTISGVVCGSVNRILLLDGAPSIALEAHSTSNSGETPRTPS